jgi:hypothetical protein
MRHTKKTGGRLVERVLGPTTIDVAAAHISPGRSTHMSARTAEATLDDTSDRDPDRSLNQDRPTDGGRAVVTLSPAAASAARRLAAKMGERTSLPEAVRRGLMLLDLYLDLTDAEELVIRNRVTGEVERIRFTWDTC